MNAISKRLLKETTAMTLFAVALMMASATVHADMIRLTITGDIYGVGDNGRLLESVLGSAPVVGGHVTASWFIDATAAVEIPPSALPVQGNYSSTLLKFSMSGDFNGVQFAPVDGGLVQINAVGSHGIVDSWRITSSAPTMVPGETISAQLSLFAAPFTLVSASPFFVPASLLQFPGTGGPFADTVSFAVCSSAGCDGFSAFVTSLTVAPVTPAAQLAALLKEVTGVAPELLEDKVEQAQKYNRSTCAALKDFVEEVQDQAGKKIRPPLEANLIADARASEASIGCK
jgi:hypothetical protein